MSGIAKRIISGGLVLCIFGAAIGCSEVQSIFDEGSSTETIDPATTVNFNVPECEGEGEVGLTITVPKDNKPLMSAVAFLQTHDYEEAVGVLEAALLDNKPADKATKGEKRVAAIEHYALAATYEVMGRSQDAVPHYRTSNQYMSNTDAVGGKMRTECKADM